MVWGTLVVRITSIHWSRIPTGIMGHWTVIASKSFLDLYIFQVKFGRDFTGQY